MATFLGAEPRYTDNKCKRQWYLVRNHRSIWGICLSFCRSRPVASDWALSHGGKVLCILTLIIKKTCWLKPSPFRLRNSTQCATQRGSKETSKRRASELTHKCLLGLSSTIIRDNLSKQLMLLPQYIRLSSRQLPRLADPEPDRAAVCVSQTWGQDYCITSF